MQSSSINPFSSPVLRHWSLNFGCEAAVRTKASAPDAATANSAISVSLGDSHSIIDNTPSRLNVDISTWLSTCCRLWLMLSMSLLTRLSTSLRGCWSNQASGRRPSLSSACWRSVRTTRCSRPVLSQACHQFSADEAAYKAATKASRRARWA